MSGSYPPPSPQHQAHALEVRRAKDRQANALPLLVKLLRRLVEAEERQAEPPAK